MGRSLRGGKMYFEAKWREIEIANPGEWGAKVGLQVSTVNEFILVLLLFAIFHMNNYKPFAPPCISKSAYIFIVAIIVKT